MHLTAPISKHQTANETLPTALIEIEDRGHLAAKLATPAGGVVWTRPIPQHVRDWLDKCPLTMLPEARFILTGGNVGVCLRQQFARLGHSNTSAINWLVEDAVRLADCVQSTEDKPYLRLRLDVVTDNACAKFHQDRVFARMICTYRGPGTEFCANRSGATEIVQLETGTAAFIKGQLWPEPHIDLYHRSPPISGTGIARLVLVLDGVTLPDLVPGVDQLYAP